jgi:hypothetical protein
MGVERRRAGFRLPWTADGEEGNGAHASADTEADEVAGAGVDTPPSAGDEVTAESSAGAAAADTAAADTAAADTATEVDSSAAADATAPHAEAESSEFLLNLVGAMRGVAETSRDTSLAELRTAIDARIEALGTQAAEKESDIRRRAELDLDGAGAWEHSEIERIRAEAERKREARRAQLEQQLAEHRTTSEREVEATRSRLTEHEHDLAAFFTQLAEISDPAAFVAAAKRMPRAPELSGPSAAPPAPAAPSHDDPRLAALGMSPPEPAEATGSEPATASTEPTETTETTEPGEEPAAVAATDSADASGPAGGTDAADASTTDVTTDTTDTAASPDNRLAERLAQLDERLSGGTQSVAVTASTPAAGNGGETSTPIIVKGLGSFGAITSFKQALERVEGIRGVTLSLGPTGEFVYRASHAGEFDLVAAIHGIEGPTATIENTDGTLVVTLSRAR